MRVREMFPDLYHVVEAEHVRVGLVGAGHDFWHAVRVAQCALMIAETPEVGRLAAAAGLCHNAPEILEEEAGLVRIGRKEPSRELVVRVERWLRQEPAIVNTEYHLIVEAVLLHTRRNEDQIGKPVVITLADADRVVNMEADLIIRSGQYYPDLLAVDPVQWLDDPQAKYREPRSVLRDIAYALEWVEPGSPVCIRLPKAWAKAQPRAEFLRFFLATVRRHWEEAGVL